MMRYAHSADIQGWIMALKTQRQSCLQRIVEDLEWAVIVPGTGEISPAVAQLLDELSARGIAIHDSSFDSW
jgi:hypothetical protein